MELCENPLVLDISRNQSAYHEVLHKSLGGPKQGCLQ